MRVVQRRATHYRDTSVPPWLLEGRTAASGPPRTMLSNMSNPIIVRANGQVREEGTYDFLWHVYQRKVMGIRRICREGCVLYDLDQEWYPLKKRALWLEVVDLASSLVYRTSVSAAYKAGCEYGADGQVFWAVPITTFEEVA